MATEQPSSVHYIHRISYSMQEKIVGIFVLLAIISFFTLFIINSKTTHLFDDYIHLHLYVNNAEGIGRDTPVRISGIEVGKVDRVEIAPDHRIRITVRVYERFTGLLRTDSIAAIGKLSLFGRSSIDITAGSPGLSQLEDGTALLVDEPLSFDQLVAELTPVVKGIEDSVQRFAALMAAIETDKVSKLVDHLLQASMDIQQISAQINSGQGTLGMALHDETFQQGLSHSVAALEKTLRATEHRLQQLDPSLQHLEQITVDTREASAHFPLLVDETTTMVRSVNTSLTSLNMEIKQLPELISRMNMLMEQTDRMLDGISNSWLFSSGDRTQRPPVIGMQPYD